MGFMIGGLTGALGARSQKKSERHHRKRLEGERDAGLGYLEEFGELFRNDPLMSALASRWLSEVDAGPGVDQRNSLLEMLMGGGMDLMGSDSALGLSNPQVQENIISAAIENELNPAYQEASRAEESRFAGRGLGRSGLAESAARERDYQYARGAADIRRQVGTEGAMQELQDKLSKLQALSAIAGQMEQTAMQRAGGAGAFGFQGMGIEGNLAQALAGLRMQHAANLTGTGPDRSNPWGSFGQGFLSGYGADAGMLGGMGSLFGGLGGYGNALANLRRT